MKRENARITYPMVTEINPLIFWKECRFCKREFKREKGYKIVDLKMCRRTDEYPYEDTYCCNECASNVNDVIKRVNRTKFLPKPLDQDLLSNLR